MDTSDLGILKAVAGSKNNNRKPAKPNRSESIKRYRSSDELQFQPEIYDDEQENLNPGSFSRNYDHLDDEYNLARESPDKRSRLGEDNLLNASHTTELSTFYPEGISGESNNVKNRIEQFEDETNKGAIQGIKNRLKQQGVDCTSYRPSPENCMKSGKNQHVNLFSPTILYETNQSASSSNLQNFSGSHNSTLQQTLEDKNNSANPETSPFFQGVNCSPVKTAKSIEDISNENYEEEKKHEQEEVEEEEEQSQEIREEQLDEFQEQEQFKFEFEDSKNYQTPVKQTDFDEEIEQAFTFEDQEKISESPVKTTTSSTVTPQVEQEAEMSFKFEFAECNSKNTEPDTHSESLTEITAEKPSLEPIEITSAHIMKPTSQTDSNRFYQEMVLIDDAINTQEKIAAQTNKSINIGSRKESINSHLMLEAERVLLKAQQTKIALFKRKQVIRNQLNRNLGGIHNENSDTNSKYKASLSLGSIVFKTYQIGRLTKRTYLLLSFCHKERPMELHVTPLIELHTLQQDHEGFIRYHLDKDIVFENINSDFEIDVNIFTLTTIDLVTDNFSPTSNKQPEKSKGLRRALGRVSTKVKDRIYQTMTKSESSELYMSKSDSNKSLASSGKSRFDHFGNFVITKKLLTNKDFGEKSFGDEQLISAVAHDMGKGYISNELFFTASLKKMESSGNMLVREGFGNVFLPVMPPTWDYRYLKLVGTNLMIFRNLGDEKPVELLKINEYEEIRVADSSECFQKWTLRLIKNKSDLRSKTMLRFPDEETRETWLTDLQAIVRLTNSWK